ncbi:MAG TPA: hypothetical protein VFO60_11850 [Candidatus Dormibacteraeota bacterium]|nr:hypothetical protein [Candidatus Dormibacteraeota bacterium]
MDFLTFLRTLFRHWILLFLGLAVTVASTGYVVEKVVKLKYSATESVLVLPPESKTATNPFLQLGDGSVAAAVPVIQQLMTDSAMVGRLYAQGATAQYAIGLADGTSTVLDIISTGLTPDEAIKTDAIVAKAMGDELVSRQSQAGASPETYIHTKVLQTPTSTTQQVGSRVKAGTAVAAVGLGLTVMIVFVFDGLVSRRRPVAIEEHEDTMDPWMVPVIEPVQAKTVRIDRETTIRRARASRPRRLLDDEVFPDVDSVVGGSSDTR